MIADEKPIESIEKFSAIVVGRKIDSVKCSIIYGRISIESITFDDGSVLELWGSCDYCRIGDISDKNGNELDYRSDDV